jgi:glutathione peroxidase
MTVHDFKASDIIGKERTLSEFSGRLLLIVNTASACGFTPQYDGLQALQKKFGDDLVVLAFPCNQFGAQEKSSDQEIASFCDLRFKVTFPLFSKIDVNGAQAHPLYRYLTHAAPGILGTQAIKWNFTKFLVGRDGKPIRRYAPTVTPASIEPDIRKAIGG